MAFPAQTVHRASPSKRRPTPMLQIRASTVYGTSTHQSRCKFCSWYLSIHARRAGSNGTVSALRAVVRGSACGRRACRFEKRHIPGVGRPASACTNRRLKIGWLASMKVASNTARLLIGNTSHKYQSSRTSASRKERQHAAKLAQRHLISWAYTSLCASTSSGARSA